MSTIGNFVTNACGNLTSLASGAVSYVAEHTPPEFNEKVAEIFNHTVSLVKENAHSASHSFCSLSVERQYVFLGALCLTTFCATKVFSQPNISCTRTIGYVVAGGIITGLTASLFVDGLEAKI